MTRASAKPITLIAHRTSDLNTITIAENSLVMPVTSSLSKTQLENEDGVILVNWLLAPRKPLPRRPPTPAVGLAGSPILTPSRRIISQSRGPRGTVNPKLPEPVDRVIKHCAGCASPVPREKNLDTDSSDARLGVLMKAAQGGDRAAYAELLKLAIPIIRRVVAPRCNRSLEVDDVVQDVLMSLHAVRHTYDPGRPFTPWLASIARHRLIDAYRKKARVLQNEAAMPELPETFSTGETNWEMHGKGDPELLHRAIEDLPAGQRHAVELLKLRELSLKEASAASGMSIAALKVAVHRGLKTLRLRLTRQDDETGERSE